MKNFQFYLDKTGEIGFVEQSLHTLAYVSGLPRAKPKEVILFETGEIGQVLSLTTDYVEVLLLSKTKVHVGTRVARTGEQLIIEVSDTMLAKTIDSMGIPISNSSRPQRVSTKTQSEHIPTQRRKEYRPIDVPPPGLNSRKNITKPYETGVTMVDLVVPLGQGQRELVVGNRKTGKTGFLMQNVVTQASRGAICVYAAIAKRRLDIKMIEEFFRKKGVSQNTIIVATSSADPAGLVYLTPYTAMTVAEYFRDSGRDTLVIMDDMTAHAKYYREITLLARRFPGRSSYPGDIFYVHARLMERAGNFVINTHHKGQQVQKEVSITCLPVAELVMSDLSGYIQTNLMAMTDGHIYFDIDLYNQGRRPPVNPFLSVTRVGRQAQTPLLRDLSRQLTSFLVHLEDLRQFMHFGAELSEKTRRELALGERLVAFFDQTSDTIIPMNINVIILASLWGKFWRKTTPTDMKREVVEIVTTYKQDDKYKQKIDSLVRNIKTFTELVDFIKQEESLLPIKHA